MVRACYVTEPIRVFGPSGGPPGWAMVVDGQEHKLSPRRATIVGSARDCDVRVTDRFISKRHAAFTLTEEGPRVRDIGSTNGIVVGGVQVAQADLARGGVAFLGRKPILVALRAGRRAPGALRWHGMIGRSAETFALWERLASAAASDAPVWLHGESGTGKELAARAIHAASLRAKGPWVALNCAALPASIAEAELFGVVRGAFTGADRSRPGAFERASGGTLMLDEIGELPLPIQAKLLRALETGEVQPVGSDRVLEVDVRVVAATWRDLETEAELGRFRHDLLHRLWVLRVDIPPLRRRREDIAALLEAFLTAARAPALWPDRATLRALEGAPWPGNVRELHNCVQRAIAGGDPTLILPTGRGQGPTRSTIRRGQVDPGIALGTIRAALREHDGRRELAARSLGISRSTLYRWLRDHG